ncbi:MAG: nucleoside recognition protein [Bosea sp.]|uniref:nucleoside recognition domain-containing protein n=1 Tax=Bosea sp. (in: a-proteobacteria) TaxID=1871050 RepID=UPI00238A7671|nr:nucleoside recognition protein [Bosea sp. (in: a-proteobacteria)]MCP4735021.1 nucleoside recognition protein [Bosea sp. (in: a-proteobacteria)]
MPLQSQFYRKTRETLVVYRELVVIMVPIAVATQALAEFGVIKVASPWIAPAMQLFGLPPELALAWLTGLLVGMWGGVVVLFTLIPTLALSSADMTVFSSLLLMAHAIPVEQRIVAKAGPNFWTTSIIRIAGAMAFAALLHLLFSMTGWLSQPITPVWQPAAGEGGWLGFAYGTAKTLLVMLAVLLILSWVMELLRAAGILDALYKGLAPLFRLVGLRKEALPFTTVGLLLGISYGSGLMLAEVRRQPIEPRQIFLASVFMGFAHSLIEDTLIMVALGADLATVLFGRLVFAIVATAAVACILDRFSDAAVAPGDAAGQQ